MEKSKPSYSSDPVWSDVIPIPQDDGGPDALAAIAYTEEYSEAMSYLRAVMADNEFSERALALTEHIIGINPSHYTVWLYRAKILLELKKDLRAEIAWLNGVALRHQKNYQIWHHRQVLMDHLDDPSGETDFIAQMFVEDAKNYHVWSYRQWLVRRFSLWASELPDVEDLLDEDIRNNSAWNHRYFIVFGQAVPVDDDIVDREISYAQSAIEMAPQNQSPWNYLRGVLRKTSRPLSTIQSFASSFADIAHPDAVRSSHALDVLADIYAEQGGREDEAVQALDLLAHRYDPIRANYWKYRKSLLGTTAEETAVAAG
ncbi:MAG: CAAX geranylgeranyltransferase alpha subunit [Piccolia ochrophora]|nr:MAG: CAAX geranylgeranyltransferase alpha subunit [Piccolia ochrophora]